MRKTVAILGVPIDDLSQEEVMQRLDEFVASGRFHQVATANTDFLINAQRDPELMTILRTADMVVPDGMPLVVASRWLRSGLRERVTGADLVPNLAKRAAEKGYRVFLLGGKPEVAKTAAERLAAQNPGLQIVGCVSPPVKHVVEMDHEVLLAEIEAARPDILFVAFGNPKQEKWIHLNRSRLAVPVCIGIGGTFDFLAGHIRRAPAWMQSSGLEWLYRLLQEPKRLWKRYSTDVVHFSRLIVAQLWTTRAGRAPLVLEVENAGNFAVLSAAGALGAKDLETFQHLADGALNSGRDLILDLQSTETIDSAVLGTMINLPKRAAYAGRRFRIVGAKGAAQSALVAAGVSAVAEVCGTFAQAVASGPAPEGRLEARVEERRLAVRIEGRADHRLAERLRACLQDSMAVGRPIFVDTSAATHVDCAVLRELRIARDAANNGGFEFSVRLGSVFRETLRREGLSGLFAESADRAPGARTEAVGGTAH